MKPLYSYENNPRVGGQLLVSEIYNPNIHGAPSLSDTNHQEYMYNKYKQEEIKQRLLQSKL
jgi:hypothetical protein